MVGLAVMRLEPAAEIGAGPCAAAVFSRVRAAHDSGGEVRLLGRIEPSLGTPLRPVMKPGKAFGIVAQHGIIPPSL